MFVIQQSHDVKPGLVGFQSICPSLWAVPLSETGRLQPANRPLPASSPTHCMERRRGSLLGPPRCSDPAAGGQLKGLSAQGLWLHLSPRIYKYQAHGYAFSGVEELLYSLGESAFVNMTQRSVAESLLQVGVTQRFIDDVVSAVLRASYGQSAAMPAFAGEPPALGLPTCPSLALPVITSHLPGSVQLPSQHCPL